MVAFVQEPDAELAAAVAGPMMAIMMETAERSVMPELMNLTLVSLSVAATTAAVVRPEIVGAPIEIAKAIIPAKVEMSMAILILAVGAEAAILVVLTISTVARSRVLTTLALLFPATVLKAMFALEAEVKSNVDARSKFPKAYM